MNARDLIREREAPTYLAKSSDFTKRASEDVFVDGDPLRHRTAIYNKGLQAEFRTVEAPWYRSLG
jgi:hypothetical protein